MEFPKDIPLTAEETKRFQKLVANQTAIKDFINNVVKQGETRAAEVRQEQEAFWNELAAKYSLSLDHVHYAPSNDCKTLMVVSVNRTE